MNATRANVYRAPVDARAVATWVVRRGMTSHVHEFAAREAHTDTYHGRFLKFAPGERVIEMMAPAAHRADTRGTQA